MLVDFNELPKSHEGIENYYAILHTFNASTGQIFTSIAIGIAAIPSGDFTGFFWIS